MDDSIVSPKYLFDHPVYSSHSGRDAVPAFLTSRSANNAASASATAAALEASACASAASTAAVSPGGPGLHWPQARGKPCPG